MFLISRVAVQQLVPIIKPKTALSRFILLRRNKINGYFIDIKNQLVSDLFFAVKASKTDFYGDSRQ
jgi:hypothetical protein